MPVVSKHNHHRSNTHQVSVWMLSMASNNKEATTASTGEVALDGKNDPNRLLQETREVLACVAMTAQTLLKDDSAVTAQEIVQVCDELDQLAVLVAAQQPQQQQPQQQQSIELEDQDSLLLGSSSSVLLLFVNQQLQLRQRALEFKRYELLAKLMRHDYQAYVATASFLSPSRIPRNQLPNVQDIPYVATTTTQTQTTSSTALLQDEVTDAPLVPDCELEDMEYVDSWLDTLLLSIFRKLVQQNTGGLTSPKPGIVGLLDQGRQFMLQPNQTPQQQHEMVYKTLQGLMTPVLPPFYRIFMSGILPKLGSNNNNNDNDNNTTIQLGPWFYAPFLTAWVTPTFFKFLVGPSRPNRRRDGHHGGLLVEKCKFLQESGCKGLCLHQCKLPAQQFFAHELGLELTVSPNFVTQECQWSFGETPLPPEQDPSFPVGCLAGCESRRQAAAAAMRTASLNNNNNLCSSAY